MGFERVFVYRIIEFDYLAPDGATAIFQTELPGNSIATRATLALPASAVRCTVKFRLPGETKGKLYEVVVTSGGAVLLYGGRVFARALSIAAAWQWASLPIPPIANTFTEIKLPIPPRGDWAEIKLPIPAWSGAFTEVKLPIPALGDWTEAKVPLHPTSELFDWLDVPVAR